MKKSEKELKKYEMRIYNTVNNIDESVRNRFKALACISDQLADISKKHDEEMLQLQYETDQKDKPLYDLRKLIVQGLDFDAEDLTIDEFDKRLEEIKGEEYDGIKIEESKNVSNLEQQQGIPDFWLIALKNNKIISKDIYKRDQKLLRFLNDIEYLRVDGTNNFILKFHFAQNDYIQNTILTKTYTMDDNDKCTKIECSEVRWKPGMSLLKGDPAIKNNKGKNKKKAKKQEDTASFFQFFTSKEQLHGNPDEDDLDDEDEERLDAIEDDFMLAIEFRDEIIPLALEYYLNIVEEEAEGEGEDIANDEAELPDGLHKIETVEDGTKVQGGKVTGNKEKDNQSDDSMDD